MTHLKALWVTNPTRVITLVTALAVFLAAKLGVVIDEQNIGEALALILPVLLGGEAIRSQVSPARPDITPSDQLLAEAEAGAPDA